MQRNLQTAYITKLDDLAKKPAKNVPSDAPALARADYIALRRRRRKRGKRITAALRVRI